MMTEKDFFPENDMQAQDVIREASKFNSTFHNHTDVSLGDGVTTSEELAQRAKEIGATSIGITDHGGCQNWYYFYNAAKKIGIKPVLGVEAYIKNKDGRYNHLILLAKNYEGYKDLSDFVTETEAHREKMRTKEIPVGTEEMLDKVSKGNVICTSACIAGPVADPFMDKQRKDKETEHINKLIGKLNIPPNYEEAARILDESNAKIKELNKIIKENEKLKNYTTANEARDEKDAINEYLTKIDEETGLSIKQTVSKGKVKQKRLAELQQQLKDIDASRIPIEQARIDAEETAKRYQARFGKDFYMEIQYHGFPMENIVYPEEVKIARKLGIPLIAANDSHIPTKDAVETRAMIENLRFLNEEEYKEPLVGDDQLYIKSGTELAESLLKIFTPDVVLEAMKNTDVVDHEIEDFEIIKQQAYPEIENANEKLRAACEKGIKEKFPNGFPSPEYNDRLEKELGVISRMNFSSYFLVINGLIDEVKGEANKRHEMWVGNGRGSGGGSLVNYLIGNTETIDPVANGLLFERFLNEERVSMPDIDTDFSADGQKYVIKAAKEEYGEEAVANIMTVTRRGLKSAIDDAARITGVQQLHKKNAYYNLGDSIKKILDENGIEDAETAMKFFKDNYADAVTQEVMRKASKLVGRITTFGQHASGVIIVGGGHKVRDYVPLMAVTDRNGNQGFAIQADMIQAEAQIGFIKFDFLGLKNLDVISRTMHLIEEDSGTRLDPYHLPVEPEVIKQIFQPGDTNFIFQFESEGMKKMLGELKPTTFNDLVLAVSVYRPGPMDFIPSIIESKNTGKPSDIVSRIPILKDVLAETYGYPVYQEQVMKIMTVCAGFSLGEADNVRRAMSKKHVEDLEAARPKFVKGALEKNGISEADSNWLFDQLMPFAKYGFNKSHAAAYAMVSYDTAYLKHHYFKEYICGALSQQGDKIPQMISDCRSRGVKIKLPSINLSEEEFSPTKDGNIIFGLSNIKGVKGAAKQIIDERTQHGEYKNIADFIWRINPDKGVIEALAKSGAFNEFEMDRKRALAFAEKYKENKVEISKEHDRLYKTYDKYKAAKEAGADQKTIDKIYSSGKRIQNEYIQAIKDFAKVTIGRIQKSKVRNDLDGEMQYLGGWISGSPLDDYSTKGYDKASCEAGRRNIAGVITEFKLLHRKRDGADMCKFKLTDKDGESINCISYVEQYMKYKDQFKNGQAVAVSGLVKVENTSVENADGVEEIKTKRELNIAAAEPLQEKREAIHVTVRDIPDGNMKFQEMVKDGHANDYSGLLCKVTFELTGQTAVCKTRFDKATVDWFNAHGAKAEIIRVDPEEYGLNGKDMEQQGAEPELDQPVAGDI